MTFLITAYDCNTGILKYKLTGGNGTSIYLVLPGVFAGNVTTDVETIFTFPSDGRVGREVSGSATQSGTVLTIYFKNGCDLVPTTPPTNPPTNPPSNPPTTPTTISLNPYSGDAYFINGVVGIGTNNVADRSAVLSVKGKIRAQEIRVEAANWPDYVFAPGYQLRSLTSLDTYLKRYRHLPGMPAAHEVEQRGAELGDLNARLLRQVEELTLHIIRLEKQIRKQAIRSSGYKSTPSN